MSCDRILQMHEFKCNTFASRMIAVFADGQDEMAFEDFLDMASGKYTRPSAVNSTHVHTSFYLFLKGREVDISFYK